MSDRKIIRNYLDAFRRYLSILNKRDIDDVVREIESHIYDVIDQEEMQGAHSDITSILERLGPPRILADDYISHLTSGTPLPEGLRTLSRIKRSVSISSYYTLMIIGYGVSLGLLAIGCANLLIPDGITIWTQSGGNAVIIGTSREAAKQASDNAISGFWMTPLAFIASYFCIKTTYSILRLVRNASRGRLYV